MYAEGRDSRTARACRRGGFTISELLIAMGLTAVLAVALLATAQIQTLVQRREEQTQLAQDHVRAALEEVAQSARLAGTSFVSGWATNSLGPTATIRAIQVQNNAGVDGSDILDMIVSDEREILTLMAPTPPNLSPLRVEVPIPARPINLASGSYVVLSDFNRAVLYRLSANPLMNNIGGIPVHDLFVTNPGVVYPTTFLPGRSIVTRVRPLRYRIDNGSFTAGTYYLTVQEGAPVNQPAGLEPVGENIEDLQVALWVDGLTGELADNISVERGAAANDDEWLFNVPGETWPAIWPPGAYISAIRITVVGRSISQELNSDFRRPAVEDHAAGAIDQYRRRVLTTQVTLRALATN